MTYLEAPITVNLQALKPSAPLVRFNGRRWAEGRGYPKKGFRKSRLTFTMFFLGVFFF